MAAYPGKNQIIIDTGTATKVDLLSNGNQFAGGIIAPGIATQLKSLHDHTSALPDITIKATQLEFPGMSTEACMVTGVRMGTAGAISFFVDKYLKMTGKDTVVLGTGGSWEYIEPLITFPVIHVPRLTLIGTALYLLLSKKKGM
jgi:type III pantothenate kinase